MKTRQSKSIKQKHVYVTCSEHSFRWWQPFSNRFWWRDVLTYTPAVKLQYTTKVAFTPVSYEQLARAFHPVSITQCSDRFAFCQAFLYVSSEEEAIACDMPMPPSRCSMDGARRDHWNPDRIYDKCGAWCYKSDMFNQI